jgi:hypothetical protein
MVDTNQTGIYHDFDIVGFKEVYHESIPVFFRDSL